MLELVIEKRHNRVMDLSIAFGLFYILKAHKAKPVLHNYAGAYVIRYSPFNTEDVYVPPIPEEQIYFAYFLSGLNKKRMMDILYGTPDDKQESKLTVDGTFDAILKYYQTPVTERTVDILPPHARKNDWTSTIGTWYGAKGQRTSGNANTGYRAPLFERWLAELGFIHAATTVRVGEHDYLLWMAIPSQSGLKEIKRFEIYKTDPEKNEQSVINSLRAHSVEGAIIKRQLAIQKASTASNIIQQFEGVLYMKGWYNGNTCSTDRVTVAPFLPVKESTLNALELHFEPNPRDKKIDLQHALTHWLSTNSKQGFYDTVAVITKEDRWVDSSESEDYMNMAGIKGLYQNEGVHRLGKALNILLYNKRGYALSVDLMDVHTIEELMRTVTQLALEHDKLTKGHFALWQDSEYNAFLEAVDNEQYSARDIASAILLQSKTRRDHKETDA